MIINTCKKREVVIKTLAYIRGSAVQQDTDIQRKTIKQYTEQNGLKVARYIEFELLSRRSTKDRKIDELVTQLDPGDTLIVSELSRLARSVGQIFILVKTLLDKGVRLICIKESFDLSPNGKLDASTRTQIELFSLFSKIEHDLISLRTREGLAAARAKGTKLGRQKGVQVRSKFDEHRTYIAQAVEMGVPLSKMVAKLGASRTGLLHYIRSRKLSKKSVLPEWAAAKSHLLSGTTQTTSRPANR